MRLVVTAAQFEVTESDDCALVCGLGNGADYLALWRDLRDPKSDSAVFLEFNCEANRGRNCITAYRLEKSRLSIDLSKQLGELAGVEGFDVELSIERKAHDALEFVLGTIFRG